MSDDLTVTYSPEKHIGHVNVLWTSGGQFMLVIQRFDDPMWIVDAHDMETNVTIELHVSGNEDVMFRAHQAAKKLKALHVFSPLASIGEKLKFEV